MAPTMLRFGWTTFTAMEQNTTSPTVLIPDGVNTTAYTVKTLLYPALATDT